MNIEKLFLDLLSTALLYYFWHRNFTCIGSGATFLTVRWNEVTWNKVTINRSEIHQGTEATFKC